MPPSALSAAMQPPLISQVDSDLLADALFPPVDDNSSDAPSTPESPTPAADSDVDDAIVPDPIPLRQPRSQLLKRVRDNLEPQIEKYSGLSHTERRHYALLLQLCKHRRQPHARPACWPQLWWEFMRDRGFTRNQVMFLWAERLEKEYRMT